MVVNSAANSDTFQVTLPSDQEIRMTRLFDAPRRLVFEAMSKPEHLKQCGAPRRGYSVTVCGSIFAGGAWRLMNRHPRERRSLRVYREIAAPPMVFTESTSVPDAESIVSSVFTERTARLS